MIKQMQQPDPVPESKPVLIVSDGEKGAALEKIDPVQDTMPGEKPKSTQQPETTEGPAATDDPVVGAAERNAE